MSVCVALLIIPVLAASTAPATLAVAFPLRAIARRAALGIDINAFLCALGDRAIPREVTAFERRMIGGVTIRTERGVHHRQHVAEHFHRTIARDGVDVFPDEFALSGHLEEMALSVRADEGVSVRKALATGADVTEEAVIVNGALAPDDLLRDLARFVVGVVVVGFAPVSGIGRVDIFIGVAPIPGENWIDFKNRGTGRALVEILAVVKHHKVARAGQARRNP